MFRIQLFEKVCDPETICRTEINFVKKLLYYKMTAHLWCEDFSKNEFSLNSCEIIAYVTDKILKVKPNLVS